MSRLFENGKRAVIGMVHCLALPGTPGYCGDMEKITEQALADAVNLEKAGCDAIIVENMGDSPFAEFLAVEQTAALAAISALVKKSVTIPVGIDAAMNDYRTSLSTALAVGGAFVRLPIFVDTVEYSGCGILQPCAHDAMIYRKNIGAERVEIFADVQVKHTHMLLPHVSIEDSARAAQDNGADAIIVTGTHIGAETPIEIIEKTKKVVTVPVIAGSGVKTVNIKEQLKIADGAIVGSSLKQGGDILNPISFKLTSALVKAFRG